MYKPKRHIRLEQISEIPSVKDSKRLLEEARKARGCTVELPWRSGKSYGIFSLTVRVELGGGQPVWTLYEGEGNRSRVVWSSQFDDIELMNDVLNLSLPGEARKSALSSEFTFAHRAEEPSQEEETSPADPAAPSIPQPESGPAFFQGEQSEFGDTGTVRITPVSPGMQLTPAGQMATAIPEVQAQPVPPPMEAYQYPPQAPQSYPPLGFPQPYPYGYYPGYPPPIDPRYQQYYPQHFPAQPPQDQLGMAQSLPVQPGAVPPGTTPPPMPVSKTDPDLYRKRPNIFLGSFLTEAGLIPETTLQAALQLQELVKSGSLNSGQAAEAVRRAHSRGGAIDPNTFSATDKPSADAREARGVAPPLGSILVEAGLVNPGALKAALNLQELARTGVMTKENALGAFVREHFGVGSTNEKDREADQTIDFMKQAGLLSQQDVDAARNVRKRHGGELAKILIAAGKLDKNTFDVADQCKRLVREDKLKVEQAIIALNYCHRSRTTLKEAASELGWEKVPV